jgi:HPt (histidine-containing phosphotransfer) domain-containing protein
MDTGSFWSRVEEDRALANELIELFFADGPRLFEAVRMAVLGNDAAALQRSAHALKGTVANFSAKPATDAAWLLENMGRTCDLSGMDEAYADLDCQLALLRLALTEFQQQVAVKC